MDENCAYWSASFQRAGEWFSSSLALGAGVVADINDWLFSDMPYLHDRATHHCLPAFSPHGGPITDSSTGSKPDSPIHPLFLRLFLALGLVCDSRATFREIINSVSDTIFIPIASNPFHALFQASNDCPPARNFT